MQLRNPFSATALILVLLGAGCMKAERLGTDTNSPEGFLVGQVALGSGGPTYAISGTITGYTGSGMVLQNNGGDNLTVAAGGTTFGFPTSVANGSAYSVSVLTPPGNPPQTCTVTSGSGTVSGAVTDVLVSCSDSVWSSTVTATVMGNGVSQSPELKSGIDDSGRAHLVTIDATTVSSITTQRVKGLILNGGAWSTTLNNGWVSAVFNRLDLAVGPNGNALLAVRNTGTSAEAYLNAYSPASGWLVSHVASGASSSGDFPRVGVAADGNGLAVIGAFGSNILPRRFAGGGFLSGAFLDPVICGAAYGSDFSYASNGMGAIACGESSNTFFRVYLNSPSDVVTSWQDVSPPAQGMVMHYGQSIAVNPSGDILVAGVDLYTPAKLYATVRQAGVWGSQNTASAALLFTYDSPDHFDTAIDAAGNGIVVWAETPSNKVFARFWNATTQAWTSVQFASLAMAPVSGPMVAISPAGYGFVTVSISGNAYLYRVDLRDQTIMPAGSSISTNDGSSRIHVAVNSRGQAVLAWTDYGLSACGTSNTTYCIKSRTLIQ